MPAKIILCIPLKKFFFNFAQIIKRFFNGNNTGEWRSLNIFSRGGKGAEDIGRVRKVELKGQMKG